jgi:hypothetical protein
MYCLHSKIARSSILGPVYRVARLDRLRESSGTLPADPFSPGSGLHLHCNADAGCQCNVALRPPPGTTRIYHVTRRAVRHSDHGDYGAANGCLFIFTIMSTALCDQLGSSAVTDQNCVVERRRRRYSTKRNTERRDRL